MSFPLPSPLKPFLLLPTLLFVIPTRFYLVTSLLLIAFAVYTGVASHHCIQR